jgi:hypothetical protein
MPCTQTGSLEGDRALAYDNANRALTETVQMLCHTLGIVEKYYPDIISELLPETQDWWEAHKEQDAEIKRELARKAERKALAEAARKKLTKKELKALRDGY